MKRAVGIPLLALLLTTTSFAQDPSAQQPKPEHFSKHQIKILIANARTPGEHRRIAQFYQSKTQDYLAQSEKQEVNLVTWEHNKHYRGASIIHHYQYEVQKFTDNAVKAQKLAELHRQMAWDAVQK